MVKTLPAKHHQMWSWSFIISLGEGIDLFIPFIDLCYLGFGRRCPSEVPHMNLTPLGIDHDNN